MYSQHLVVLAFWAVCALSAVVPRLVLHESRDSVPHQWTKRLAASRDLTFPVMVAVRQGNHDAGHEELMAIADPNSPNFGKHWTAEQIRDFFAPSKEDIEAIRQWLDQSGIDSKRHHLTQSRGHVSFQASVDEMEALLGTQYYVYEHEDGTQTLSCEEYHVPEHLKDNIDFVSPTIGLDQRSIPTLQKKRTPNAAHRRSSEGKPLTRRDDTIELPDCTEMMHAACINERYGIPHLDQSVPGNDVGLFGLAPYTQEDLDEYFWQFSPWVPQGTHPKLQSIDGGVAPVDIAHWRGGYEEVELPALMPLVYPQPVRLYHTYASINFLENPGFFNNFLDALDGSFCTYDGGDDPEYDPTFPNDSWNHTEMCGTYEPTNVILLGNFASESKYSPAYLQRQCHEFMKLSLQGTTFIVNADDFGTNTHQLATGWIDGDQYNPTFPATCPYVTVVGATQKQAGAALDGPEESYDASEHQLSTGSGFSAVFARPSWQDDVVATYLQSEASGNHSHYNVSGRAYPDVSVLGATFGFFFDGILVNPNTASAVSAAIFAGMISRINGERIQAGKGSLGFLNPTLYKNADVFDDVTKGQNYDPFIDPAFSAAEGWDAVTGLGTPKYDQLREVLLNLD